MAKKEAVPERKSTVKETLFTKECLMKSIAYRNRADLLSVLLEDGASYTKKEADEKIENFMKGKVN